MTAQHVDDPPPLLGRRAPPGSGAPSRQVGAYSTSRVGRVRSAPAAAAIAARAASAGSRRVPCDSTSTRGSPVTGTRSSGSPNADSSRPRTRCDAAGSTRIRCAAPRYMRASSGAHRARTREDAAAHGLGRVQADALERDAVPQLHDERTRHRVAVDVAEPVGDDDHARAGGEPESPQRVLARVWDAAGGGIPSLARRADQPDRGVTRRRRPRSTAPGRRRRCRRRSRRPSLPAGVGSQGWRCDRGRTAG